jgi:hypothetical protein
MKKTDYQKQVAKGPKVTKKFKKSPKKETMEQFMSRRNKEEKKA